MIDNELLKSFKDNGYSDLRELVDLTKPWVEVNYKINFRYNVHVSKYGHMVTPVHVHTYILSTCTYVHTQYMYILHTDVLNTYIHTVYIHT